MSVPSRTIWVGSKEYVAVVIKAQNGQNLSQATVSLAVVPQGKHPVTWETPGAFNITGNVITAEVLVVGSLQPRERSSVYSVFARIQVAPEDIIINCGAFVVK